MRRKGFTLIELLAVIVILAVIALITIPLIGNVIEDSRKKAFEITCEEIYNAYEQYEIQNEILIDSNGCSIFEFDVEREEREIEGEIYYEPISKLNLKGELPKSGKYKICNGKKELIIDNGKYTCIRDENRKEILEGNVIDNDITAPLLEGINVRSTTRSIKIVVEAKEEDGIITKYYYKINGEEVSSENNTYIFDELESNQEYEIEVTVENKAGLKSNTIVKKVMTREITEAQYEETQTPEGTEYAISKNIKVKYETEENLIKYVKSNVEVKVEEGEVIGVCGVDTMPGECTEDNRTTLEANTWYKVKEEINIECNENGVIYTITSDGINKTGMNTYTVSKIDTEEPTVEVSLSGKVVTLTLKDETGVVGYQVTTSEEKPEDWETSSGTNTTETWTASSAGTYYAWVKDNVGRTSYEQFEIASTAFCAYNVGQVWTYNYTGGIQSFTVPCNGTYKLEVWGAQGGRGYSWRSVVGPGGYGGYAQGNIALTKDAVIYIGVGGQGTNATQPQSSSAGGFNGGGQGGPGGNIAGGGGGGCTHMGTFNQTLTSHGSTSGLYIVAGGGGGGSGYYNAPDNEDYDPALASASCWTGGAGGGATGGNGTQGTDGYPAPGASQSGPGSNFYRGKFGQGGNTTAHYAGGGGGGLYGGAGGSQNAAGGGGSGYIGGVTDGSMKNGQRSGNGMARITLVSI